MSDCSDEIVDDEAINNICSVLDIAKLAHGIEFAEAELTVETLKSTCQELLLKLHPDKKQSTNANFSYDKDSDNSKLEKVLAAWKFLSKYSLNKNDHTLIRKILAYRNQSSKESETNSDSKPLWKIVSITRFSAEVDDLMVHACRCGGKFVLSREDFESLKDNANGESPTYSNLTCKSENEDCDCHEILEVECETCSLIMGVKSYNPMGNI